MLWVKAFHILAVISWMAGLLYLPRLYVYHRDVDVSSETSNLFIVMEYRLLRFIMLPAAIVTFITGFYLALTLALFGQFWFIVKFICVIFMAICHAFLQGIQEQFAKGERPLTSKAFRIINEIPTLLMIIIVVMVVVKP